MRTFCVKNALVMIVILLFVGVAVQPSIATVKQEVDVEPKDYLFQTIIDIVNNPNVKNLLEQYKYELFKVDIDRSVYRKIFFKNPRLFSSLIFTKPSLSIEYLEKCYTRGIEITSIIGEDKALEMIESIRIINLKVFDELSNIFTRNEELSKRISAFQVLNKDGLICNILMLIAYPIGWLFILMTFFIERNEVNPIRFTIFTIIGIPINVMMVCMVLLLKYLQCLDFPP